MSAPSKLRNSMFGAGTLIKGARVRNSILRREIVLEADVELDECIIMDYVVVRRGSRLRRVIIDRYNTVEPNSTIGYDLDSDKQKYFVTDSGITVMAKGTYTPEFSRFQ
jgi:glucose-1-phosphate adenylyltransferase